MMFRVVSANKHAFGIGWVATLGISGLHLPVYDFRVLAVPLAAIEVGMFVTAIGLYVAMPVWITYRELTRDPEYYHRGVRSGWNVGMAANTAMGIGSILAGGVQISVRVGALHGQLEEAAGSALVLLLGLIVIIWVGAIMGVAGFGLARMGGYRTVKALDLEGGT